MIMKALILRYPPSWLALGCLTWLQAINGSPGCWSLLQQQYHISHVQLNNLVVAWETGRLFGCLSDAAGDYLAASKILFIGLVFGLIGYGLQYLCIAYKFPCLSYWQVLLLNALAGNSTCWISTYCQLLAIEKFSDNHEILTATTSCYSGLSAKVYASLIEGTRGSKGSRNSASYLLFVCLVFAMVLLTVSVVNNRLSFVDCHDVERKFPIVFAIAIAIGIYAMIESILPVFVKMSPQLRAVLIVMMLTLPSAMGLLISAVHFTQQKYLPKLMPKALNNFRESTTKDKLEIVAEKERDSDDQGKGSNENGLKQVFNVDFWLFYLVNAFGATLGSVYLNNLERIYSSRGINQEATYLLATSSMSSFFARIFSVMFRFYAREKSTILNNIALTVLLMMPMPVAFFLLISDNPIFLYISTGILGTCSGLLNAMSSSTLSELAGYNNLVVKKTVVLTNVPIGFLVFGYLGAVNYQKEGAKNHGICRGLQCYYNTFIIWGSLCFLGTVLSFLLHLYSLKSFYVKRLYDSVKL